MAIDTEALKAKALKATPGPWQVRTEPLVTHFGEQPERTIHTVNDHPQLKGPAPVVTYGATVAPAGGSLRTVYISEEDAEFIADANPATVLELLAELDRLRAETAWVPVEPGEKLPPLVHSACDDDDNEWMTSEDCLLTCYGTVVKGWLVSGNDWVVEGAVKVCPPDAVTAWRYSPAPYEQPESKENNTP